MNLAGHVFGRWTVLGCSGRTGEVTGKMHGQTTWRCRCECGKVKERVNYGALMSGVSRSCGCLRGEALGARARKHGDARGKAYRAWQQAQQRCFNPGRRSWESYGGRGITMCEGFRGSYPAWRDALGAPPTVGHSVDRRNNEGNYSCGMCSQCVENRWEFNIHWATQSEQMSNTRRTRKYPWGGKLMTLTEIARRENVAYCTFRNRMSLFRADIADALEYCRGKGLQFSERSQFVLEGSPDAVEEAAKARRRRRDRSLVKVENGGGV